MRRAISPPGLGNTAFLPSQLVVHVKRLITRSQRGVILWFVISSQKDLAHVRPHARTRGGERTSMRRSDGKTGQVPRLDLNADASQARREGLRPQA